VAASDRIVPRVHQPRSLHEALSLYASNPHALLYAGGTWTFQGHCGSHFPCPRDIIALEKLEELRRMGRWERFLELGAAVSLGQILSLGEHSLPPLIPTTPPGHPPGSAQLPLQPLDSPPVPPGKPHGTEPQFPGHTLPNKNPLEPLEQLPLPKTW